MACRQHAYLLAGQCVAISMCERTPTSLWCSSSCYMHVFSFIYKPTAAVQLLSMLPTTSSESITQVSTWHPLLCRLHPSSTYTGEHTKHDALIHSCPPASCTTPQPSSCGWQCQCWLMCPQRCSAQHWACACHPACSNLIRQQAWASSGVGATTWLSAARCASVCLNR